MAYPEWFYYPSSVRPPDWVTSFVEVVSASRPSIESASVDALTSDRVLAALRPGLLAMGFSIEENKKKLGKIRRPVLFGENGHEKVAYEVDGYHDGLGVILEVEAGRGARGNAVFRDLIRTSLIVDAKFLVLGVMLAYRFLSGGKPTTVASYADARNALDAIYASGRLKLPFEGILLFGY